MMSFNMLLCAVVLVLAISVEAFSGGYDNYNYDLSGPALTDLYNSPVYNAERMIRPIGSSSSGFGAISHSGVRVTLADGSQWLVHKGANYGLSSKTVVTDAKHMSDAWRVASTRDYEGTKTVSDFVKTGGSEYKLFSDNCHDASKRMMNQ